MREHPTAKADKIWRLHLGAPGVQYYVDDDFPKIDFKDTETLSSLLWCRTLSYCGAWAPSLACLVDQRWKTCCGARDVVVVSSQFET